MNCSRQRHVRWRIGKQAERGGIYQKACGLGAITRQNKDAGSRRRDGIVGLSAVSYLSLQLDSGIGWCLNPLLGWFLPCWVLITVLAHCAAYDARCAEISTGYIGGCHQDIREERYAQETSEG
jgi:hypothetical protein